MIGRIVLTAAALALVAVKPIFAQEDVDELKKRYKNMPGGDIIAAQLEAHRAEIEAANAKQKSQMAQMGYDKPAKGAKEVLALIPALPKTVAEAKARLGKVENGNGGKVDGDAKAAAATHEQFAAMAAAARGGMPPMEGGIVRNNEGQTFKQLNEDTGKLVTETHDGVMELMKASQAAEKEHDRKLDALATAVHKKLDDARCELEEAHVQTAAEKARCAAIGKAYLADVTKQRQAFLDALNGLATPYRAKLDGWTKQGQALEAKAASIKSASLQGVVAMTTSKIRAQMLEGTMELLAVDGLAVTRASEKMPQVW